MATTTTMIYRSSTPLLVVCTKCRTDKDAREFSTDSRKSNGLNSWCIECCNKQKREKQYWRKGKGHGLDKEGFEQLREAQNWRCLCCDKEPSVFYTDHNHDTGKVRGLLCRNCNLGIGYLGDDIEGVMNALWYLLQTQE